MLENGWNPEDPPIQFLNCSIEKMNQTHTIPDAIQCEH